MYDKLGRTLSATDANGNTTLYEYNAFNTLRKVTLPGDSTIPSLITYSQYDTIGRAVRSCDSVDREVLMQYDNQGRVLSKTERKLDGTQAITLAYHYDVDGNVRFATDGNGTIKEYTYDNMNQLLTETVGGKTSTYTYDANGNKLTSTDWNGNTYTNIYDALNRLVERRDPFQTVIERLEYNRNNVQTATYDALGHGKVFAYDRNNRVIGTTDTCSHTTSQTYDNVGNLHSKTDGNNNTTVYGYDEFNRLISVTNAKNEITSYTYDGNGNVLTVTDGKGNVTAYEYNVRNLLIKYIMPGGRTGTPGNYTYDNTKVERSTYTADRLLLTKTDKNGTVLNYEYDIHGRMTELTAGSITIAYTYDNNGNVLTMTDGTGTTTRTYDVFNRTVTKNVPEFGLCVYVYDITQNLPVGYVAETTTDSQGNLVMRVYDRAGRLYQVISDGETATYTYYANGSLQKLEYDGGASEEYTYYNDNMLHTLVNKKADGTVIDSYTYTYDDAHNMLSKVDAKGTTSYTYDQLNRLLTVTEPSGQTTAYTFDAAGNRASQTITLGTNTIMTTYTYDAQNRLTGTEAKTNGVTVQTAVYTYDYNGNQLVTTTTEYVDGVPQTPVVTATNAYDTLNQLISTVTSDGYTILNTYNGDGLRVAKSVNGVVTYYLYEASRVVLEQDAQGNQTARNVYGTNLISRQVGADTFTYMYNGHADVTALLDSNGNLVATYYYDAFGNILEKTGTVENYILYGGYQYDEETGLYYLNAQMYDPVTARFLQQDTYKGQYNDPLSLNLYTYCQNEPLMYSDPTGHAPMTLAAMNMHENFKSKPVTIGTMNSRDTGYHATYNKGSSAGSNNSTSPKTEPVTIATMNRKESDKSGSNNSGSKNSGLKPISIATLNLQDPDYNTKPQEPVCHKPQVPIIKPITPDVNSTEAITTGIIATAAIVGGVLLMVICPFAGAAVLGSAILGGGIGLAVTEVVDFWEDGYYNKSSKEYLAAFASGAVAGGLMPGVGSIAAGTNYMVIAGSQMAWAGAVGFTSNGTYQYIANGNIDYSQAVKSGLGSAATYGLITTGTNYITGKYYINVTSEMPNAAFEGTSSTQEIYNANGDAALRATRRPTFDSWVSDGVEMNGQTFKLNQHAENSLFKSGRKDIMPNDITDALATKPQPAQPGSVQYVNPNSGTTVFVNPTTNEIVGVWPSGFGK